MIQKNKKTMIKEKGKEICQRVLDTNRSIKPFYFFSSKVYNGFDEKILEGKFIVFKNEYDR